MLATAPLCYIFANKPVLTLCNNSGQVINPGVVKSLPEISAILLGLSLVQS
jgi:hypothetical protein